MRLYGVKKKQVISMDKKWRQRIATGLCAAMLTGAAAPVFAQSLWSDNVGGESMLFADHKARNVGDILTIVISETATASMTKASNNSKSGKTELGAGVGIFGFWRRPQRAARTALRRTDRRRTQTAPQGG